jgi:protein-L-isoaspartate O-methyltransferase
MPISFGESAIAIVRRAYARQMLAVAGIASNPELEDAFAIVKREDFLGPAPWQFSYAMGYQTLPFADPVLAYQDILFALSPSRGVNNGGPSLHVKWLNAAMPLTGKRIAHIGAGSGYYTAIMAQLVGKAGHVAAVEIDPVLADMARTNLARQSNVSVIGHLRRWRGLPERESRLHLCQFLCRKAGRCMDRKSGAWRPLDLPAWRCRLAPRNHRRTPRFGRRCVSD